MDFMVRDRIKRNIARSKRLQSALEFLLYVKFNIRNAIIAINYSVYDFWVELRHMRMRRSTRNYWKLSSELIFWYHKLEKGLSLPEPHRFFGIEAAFTTCKLMREWERSGLDMSSPIYSAAVEILVAYEARLECTPPPSTIKEAYLANLRERILSGQRDSNLSTPFTPPSMPVEAVSVLEALCLSRRSVRSFSKQRVEYHFIEKAISVAQLSPSACNRQPWHVHLYEDEKTIEEILRIQKGSSGFSQTIPLLGVITSDMNSFQDLSERLEPALDAGLFLMTLLLALQAQGLSTCCLNWCVPPKSNRQGHKVGRIADNEKIVACLAIGYATEDVRVPRSARRPIGDVLKVHTS